MTECTAAAGCHQHKNDTVYIRECFEIIEPRGVVSRVKKQWAKLGTLRYTLGMIRKCRDGNID